MREIIKNKKAYHDFEMIKTYEVGIALIGPEVKSIYNKRVNLKGSFCKFAKNELFVFGLNVTKFENSNKWSQIDEKRDKKLLLHRKELDYLQGKVNEDRLTIVPLRIYFNDENKCKMEIAIAKGKKDYDKKESNKQKAIKRDVEREYKQKIK